MSSIKKRLSALGLAAASALAISSFAAPAASAATCSYVEKTQVGPLVVSSSENDQYYDYCSTIDFGTVYKGVNGAPSRVALGNVKIGENLYVIALVESYVATILGIGSDNNGWVDY